MKIRGKLKVDYIDAIVAFATEEVKALGPYKYKELPVKEGEAVKLAGIPSKQVPLTSLVKKNNTLRFQMNLSL